MATEYRTSFSAGWGMMDFNGHMANTAYLDAAADTRMRYFKEGGFPMESFARSGFGPVVRRDEIDYIREIRLLESFDVVLVMAGLATDGSRMKLRNLFYRADGTHAVTVTSFGGWLGFKERRLIVPPPAIHELLAALPRTRDFQELPSVVAGGV